MTHPLSSFEVNAELSDGRDPQSHELATILLRFHDPYFNDPAPRALYLGEDEEILEAVAVKLQEFADKRLHGVKVQGKTVQRGSLELIYLLQASVPVFIFFTKYTDFRDGFQAFVADVEMGADVIIEALTDVYKRIKARHKNEEEGRTEQEIKRG